MIIRRTPEDRKLRQQRHEKIMKELSKIDKRKPEPIFKTNRLTGDRYGYSVLT